MKNKQMVIICSWLCNTIMPQVKRIQIAGQTAVKKKSYQKEIIWIMVLNSHNIYRISLGSITSRWPGNEPVLIPRTDRGRDRSGTERASEIQPRISSAWQLEYQRSDPPMKIVIHCRRKVQCMSLNLSVWNILKCSFFSLSFDPQNQL